MSTAAPVSVEEYLRATYDPDCDYVDGEIQERNSAERDHSDWQSELVYYFRSRRRQWKLYAWAEQRLQVSATRFRVPDVCVTLERPAEQVFKSPPFVCIEVLSAEDRMTRVQDRIDDYLRFGVRYVWVIDPASRRVWVHTAEGSREVKDGVLRTENPDLSIKLSEIVAGFEG